MSDQPSQPTAGSVDDLHSQIMEIRALLAEAFGPREVDVWLSARRDEFGTANAWWLIHHGEAQRVLDVVCALREEASRAR